MSDDKQKQTGLWKVDPFRFRKALLRKGWTQEELEKKCLSRQTVKRMAQGGEAKMKTLLELAETLGVKPIEIVDPSCYENPKEVTPPPVESSWEISEPLGEVQTASNGMVYRTFRMVHRHQPMRLGRGKRYELFELPTDEKEQLRARLLRHADICDLVGRCPQLPICYTTYPDTREWVWWVIDEWVDGVPLAQRIDSQPICLADAARWAEELAIGIQALHAAQIIRRELNPRNVLVREQDGSLLFTDFELAKLSGEGPTVSGIWPDDPYRAIEVGLGTPTPAADLYSWGRIVTHMVTGKLPPRGQELEELGTRLSSRISKLIAHCTLKSPSERCQTVEEVLPTVKKWKQETCGAG